MNQDETTEKVLGALVTIILGILLLVFGSSTLDLLWETVLPRPPIEVFYWSFRSFDVLVQAFIILAAAAAVASFFRRNPKVLREEETLFEEDS